MPTLKARFDIALPGQCLVSVPDNSNIRFQLSLGDFNIEMQIIPGGSSRSKGKDEPNWTCTIERVVVDVSRVESKLPPVVVPDSTGCIDYSIQMNYFEERTTQFATAAQDATNRLISFFQFKLHTPLLHALPLGHQCFQNPKWLDDSDQIVGKSPIVMVCERVPGEWGTVGVKKLTTDKLVELEKFLTNPVLPSLTEEFASNAQSAWFEGHLRRAVLELAIACEIAVKRRFFAISTPAGAAFDYLEDKAKINIRVLELADKVAQESFGRSFRVDHPNDYLNIDHLFRCRNKVAHRGELSFRDDSAKLKSVDSGVVESWWHSVAILTEWLSKL